MKNLFIKSLLIAPMLLSADVMPAINSKGGALVLPEGKLKMGITHINFERNSMFEGSSEVQNKENLDATANITMVALSYGLSNKTTISAIVPYKNIEATARLGLNDVAIDNKGLGDVVLAARHVLISMSDANYQLSLDAAVKLPTGATNGSFKTAPAVANGANTPMPTQMGTGEFEYMLGLGATKMISESWEADAHAMYTHRPKAHNNYDFGDEIALNLSTTKAVTNKLNIGIEYNIKYNTKTNMGDDTNAQLRAILPFKAFSGTAAYVTPQVEFLPFGKPKIHMGVGVSFLAHYDLKEYQPLEKERFIVRLGYLF
ncbi:MAG: transporter [Sulfurimonas sp.]|uniref:transporter n=1 Tax=Sulfurimonas sp. TaxID=2022749 RepID=UPI0028CDA925|nr:transporter [Sulfurimonas sp.]MDT8338949.1 transporter [Sulfurimonas sp.]